MESRYPATQEKVALAVDSHQLSEILTLALKLQTQGEELISEPQILEMARELGIRPEHVYEAIRLKGCSPLLPSSNSNDNAARRTSHGDGPIAAVTRTLVTLFALGLLPLAWGGLAQEGLEALPVFAMLAAFIAGWTAQYPRLARVTGAIACPLAFLVASFYTPPFYYGGHHPFPGAPTTFLALLSLSPLCSSVGAGSARLRRWLQRLSHRPRLTAVGP